MSSATRKVSKAQALRREQLMSEHQHATALRELFPGIEQVRIELVFRDPAARSPPSPQLHTLYPAAPAFFRFACPCADCDGDFDLTDAVTALIASCAGCKRTASIGGQLSCHGMRFRDHDTQQTSCPMQLSYQLHSEARSQT
jgi:hypothetical protein